MGGGRKAAALLIITSKRNGMADFNQIRQEIDQNIYENQDGDITGEVMNEVLNDVVDAVEDAVTNGNNIRAFKGWWPDLAALKAAITAEPGDSAYVKDASPATTWSIYVYDATASSDNYWADSGTDADTSSVQSFASGEEVNETYIDDTHLVNPKDGALPTANDTMQLKAKLGGVTASAVKVNETPANGYVNGSNGSIAQYTGMKYIETPIGDAKHVRFLGVKVVSSTSSGYAFGHYTDESDPTTWVTDMSAEFDRGASSATTKEYELDVPNNATHFRTTSANSAVPGLSQNFYCYLQSGESVVELVDGLDKKINGEDYEVIGDDILPASRNTQWKICSSSATGTDSALTVVSSNNSYYIGLSNHHGGKLLITANATYTSYYMMLKKEISTNDAPYTVQQLINGGYLCEEVHQKDGVMYPSRAISSKDTIEIPIPNDALFILLSGIIIGSNSNRNVQSVKIISIEHVNGTIDTLKEAIAELANKEQKQGEPLKLVLKEGKCFTAPISLEKGFYIKVKEQYKLTNGYLLDHLTGEVVDDKFPIGRTFDGDICRKTSSMCKIPGFDVMIQIESIDGSNIESYKGVIDTFAIVTDIYTRKLPNDIDASVYHAFRNKLQTSIGSVWTPSLQAARKIPRSGGNADTNRYRRGVTYLGVNYSGPTEWGKHVGMEVSMRTFITAINNPRSVMYTERIDGSGAYEPNNPYGFTHNSFASEAGAYYGCVCTGLTSYLLGLNSVIPSSAWKVSGTSWGAGKFDVIMQGTSTNPNIILCGEDEYHYDNDNDCKALAELLNPMDFIWNTGHCAVISDIYKDEWGEIKYIVISEETAPNSLSEAYTPKDFFERNQYMVTHNRDWQVLRKKTAWTIGEASIPRAGQDKEFVVMNNSQYNPEDMGNVDKDITTFSGEGAVFVIGDYSDNTNNFKMFLNIHRGGSDGYNYIQLFSESDDESTATPIDEIDISSNGGNVAQSDILDADAATEEDWIIYNLAEYWRVNQPNNTGKFKARVVRKESNSVVLYSGCAHFEFVKIEVSINTETNKFGFVVKGGTPVQYRIESENGLIAYAVVKDLTPSDYTTEDDVHTGTNLTIPSSWNSGYIRLFVKTDYGMANRRIAYTKPTN